MTKIYTTTVYGSKDPSIKPYLLDITVKSASGIGALFAPTWEIVMGVKEKRITEAQYTAEYLRIMKQRFIDYPELIDWILSQETIYFMCYCKPDEFCHRVILAKLLVEMGLAIYGGEV